MKRITSGFDFQEALLLATFSQQAYEIFKYDDGTIDDIELRGVYNSIYKNQDWKFAHSIRSDAQSIRGFIVKKEGFEQYSVVIQGSVMSDGKAFDLTDAVNVMKWDLVDYGSVTNKRIKILGIVEESLNAVWDEIDIFFKVILGKLKEKDFTKIYEMSHERQFACITAMADAGQYRLGEDFFISCRELIEEALEDGIIGNDDDLVKILDFQKKRLLSLEKVDETIDVYVTGHSLGAAVALLCILELKAHFPLDMILKLYSVGTPKIGNQEFADYYKTKIGKGMSYRIHNILDPIASSPPSPPFPLDALVGNGLRIGDFYIGNLAHSGEDYTVMGLGSQGVSLDFGGAISLFGGIPFPHSPDTYIQLLEEEQEKWENWSRPLENMMTNFMKGMFDGQTAELREELHKLKKEIEELKLKNS